MKERPILFSAPMVRAILEGRKTMTRRIVKHSPKFNPMLRESDQWEEFIKRCPFGTIGDRLWVRESFCTVGRGWIYKTDDPKKLHEHGLALHYKPSIHMPRSASRITLEITNIRVERLQEITEDDAIAEGVEQMAVPKPQRIWWKNYDPLANKTMAVPSVFTDPRQSFQSLWESINGKGSWEANPWVWVIEFKRIA